MRRIFPVLHGQCTALRSLSIRQPGIFADIDQFHNIADDQFDQEFALFLRSVKPTLQRLDYEIRHPFGIEQTDIESPPRRAWFGNQQFVRYLLPVLLEPEWPAIQAVRISGVSWMGDKYCGKLFPWKVEVDGEVMYVLPCLWRKAHISKRDFSCLSLSFIDTWGYLLMPCTIRVSSS